MTGVDLARLLLSPPRFGCATSCGASLLGGQFLRPRFAALQTSPASKSDRRRILPLVRVGRFADCLVHNLMGQFVHVPGALPRAVRHALTVARGPRCGGNLYTQTDPLPDAGVAHGQTVRRKA